MIKKWSKMMIFGGIKYSDFQFSKGGARESEKSGFFARLILGQKTAKLSKVLGFLGVFGGFLGHFE